MVGVASGCLEPGVVAVETSSATAPCFVGSYSYRAVGIESKLTTTSYITVPTVALKLLPGSICATINKRKMSEDGWMVKM